MSKATDQCSTARHRPNKLLRCVCPLGHTQRSKLDPWQTSAIPTLHDVSPLSGETPIPAFKNEAFLNFGNNDVKRAMQQALRSVESELGHEYSLIIGGERVTGSAKIHSVNPARPAQIVGIHPEAEPEHVHRAVAAAAKAFSTWQAVPVP